MENAARANRKGLDALNGLSGFSCGQRIGSGQEMEESYEINYDKTATRRSSAKLKT